MMMKLEQLLQSKVRPQKSNIVDAIHKLAERIHRRSMVILFTDMFESTADTNALFEALQHLKYNKHEVILFHIIDKETEMDFNFQNRPYQFIDSETGEKIKLFPSQIKEQYLTQLHAFQQQLKVKCAQYKIDLNVIPVTNDFSQVLTAFLVKRSKMY